MWAGASNVLQTRPTTPSQQQFWWGLLINVQSHSSGTSSERKLRQRNNFDILVEGGEGTLCRGESGSPTAIIG